jgi:putative endonuclease
MDRNYCVYILASRSRSLYTGVTNNLQKRVQQHREGTVSGFTSRYRTHHLVHFEIFSDVRAAIRREKEIKGWRRAKKVALIEQTNPRWEELAGQTSPFVIGGVKTDKAKERGKARNDAKRTADPSSAEGRPHSG